MHGSVMSALRSYIVARVGPEGWHAIVVSAGIDHHPYVPTQQYPDNEAVSLILAASTALRMPVKELLSEYGESLAPQLLRLYRAFIPAQWNALDLVEHVETTIHKVVRRRDPNANPPQLVCSRPAEDEAVVLYSSPRRMCGLALGLLRGIGEQYGEKLDVREETCMLNGDANCTIHVRRLPSGTTA